MNPRSSRAKRAAGGYKKRPKKVKETDSIDQMMDEVFNFDRLRGFDGKIEALDQRRHEIEVVKDDPVDTYETEEAEAIIDDAYDQYEAVHDSGLDVVDKVVENTETEATNEAAYVEEALVTSDELSLVTADVVDEAIIAGQNLSTLEETAAEAIIEAQEALLDEQTVSADDGSYDEGLNQEELIELLDSVEEQEIAQPIVLVLNDGQTVELGHASVDTQNEKDAVVNEVYDSLNITTEGKTAGQILIEQTVAETVAEKLIENNTDSNDIH